MNCYAAIVPANPLPKYRSRAEPRRIRCSCPQSRRCNPPSSWLDPTQPSLPNRSNPNPKLQILQSEIPNPQSVIRQFPNPKSEKSSIVPGIYTRAALSDGPREVRIVRSLFRQNQLYGLHKITGEHAADVGAGRKVPSVEVHCITARSKHVIDQSGHFHAETVVHHKAH